MSTDTFKYDVAISFAREQRSEAESIASCLQNAGVRVFYDQYEEADLWGKNLYDHLADVYQNQARYCLMLVSAAYAAKVWPNHERQNAQARALSQKIEYILPVRFDEIQIPGLPNTVSYVRFKDHGADGICKLLLQKLSSSSNPGPATPATSFADDPDQFWAERRKLGDRDNLKKIWSRSRWCIWIRPTEFKKARFRNLDQCRRFLASSRVEFRGSSSPFPWFSAHGIETGAEWIASEIETDGGNRLERWVLFRSGQFVDNFALDPRLGNRTHVLEILDTSTAAFEFAARMAHQGVLSPQAAIRFDLFSIDGRQLTWPIDVFGDNVKPDCWCQDENITVSRVLNPEELQKRTEALALEAAIETYSRFGWSDPPIVRLQDAQSSRFGDVRQWRN